MRILCGLTALLLALLSTPSTNAQAGFDNELLVSDFEDSLTDFCFDGSLLFVAVKGGELLVFEDENGDSSYSQRTRALDLEDVICTDNERGLLGVTVHPDFDNNRFVYLYYTRKQNDECKQDHLDGPVNRLSRFPMSGSNTLDLDDELVLFETSPLEYNYRNGGGMAFGTDGLLYVAVGDGGSTFAKVSLDPGNLLGTLVRVTDNGDIPVTNPYSLESGETKSARCNVGGKPPEGSPEDTKCEEIFALGLSNSRSIAMDPHTDANETRFYLNDAGEETWEEIHEGGTSFMEANYAWPDREGPCPYGTSSNCGGSHSFQDPIHFYQHVDNVGDITGGDFVPAGAWPVEYDGGYLYADATFNKIYLVKDGTEEPCFSCNPPESNKNVTDFATAEQVVSMGFGPFQDTQALYYSTAAGAIHRIVYTGDGNRAPVAVMVADRTQGEAGLTVQFSGTDSSDADNQPLNYTWDLDGNGSKDATTETASYNYTKDGTYVATLTVKDSQGATSVAKTNITIGKMPMPVITSPTEGTTFAVGDVITLTGEVAQTGDAESRDTSLTWEVRLRQNDRYSPFLKETKGNNIKLEKAPGPPSVELAATSFLEIVLTATDDASGLSASVTRQVSPKIVNLDFVSEPSGLELLLDGSRLQTPINAATWENQGLRVDAPAQVLDDKTYIWSRWSIGGGKTQTIKIRPANETVPIVAIFTERNGTMPPTSTTEEDCLPISLGLVTDGDPLLSGDFLENSTMQVYVQQQFDGNLVARKGTPSIPGDFIWESGFAGAVGNYFTVIVRNSDMITYEGRPESRGPLVWQSGTSGIVGDHFLGVDCSGEEIHVYQGRPNNPGRAVWPGKAPASTAEPASAPTTATDAPTLSSSSIVRNTLIGASLVLTLVIWMV